jgi:hypothetical protein
MVGLPKISGAKRTGGSRRARAPALLYFLLASFERLSVIAEDRRPNQNAAGNLFPRDQARTNDDKLSKNRADPRNVDRKKQPTAEDRPHNLRTDRAVS